MHRWWLVVVSSFFSSVVSSVTFSNRSSRTVFCLIYDVHKNCIDEREVAPDASYSVANLLRYAPPFSLHVQSVGKAAKIYTLPVGMLLSDASLSNGLRSEQAQVALFTDEITISNPLMPLQPAERVAMLERKIAQSYLPAEVLKYLHYPLLRLGALKKPDDEIANKIEKYINWILLMPWGKQTYDLFYGDVHKDTLDDTKLGIAEKDAVTQIIEQFKTGEQLSGVKLGVCLVGGTADMRQRVARVVAHRIGRKKADIVLSGLNRYEQLMGSSYLFDHAEPGAVVKAVQAAGSMNPLMVIDYGSSILYSGVAQACVELLDPAMTRTVYDQYVDFTIDLSSSFVLVIAEHSTIDFRLEKFVQVISLDKPEEPAQKPESGSQATGGTH